MSDIIPGYCTLCRSRCGTLNEVANDHLIKVRANPEHPNGKAMCMKGKAAPELVDSANRILYPMKRTHPKGAENPGWKRISWEEAMSTIAGQLEKFKRENGAESVAFGFTSPSGTPLSDAIEWLERFVRIYGSPNTSYGTEICNWHKDVAHRWTFGCGIPVADYSHADLILLWGHNPANTWLAQASAIGTGRNNGAKLIVVDPRPTPLAKEANAWLDVNPGTDGALALGLSHLLVERNLFNHEFVRNWTNGPLLVRNDNGYFLREKDINPLAISNRYTVWDEHNQQVTFIDSETRTEETLTPTAALEGNVEVAIADGAKISCQTAFSSFKDMLANYDPENVSRITGVSVASIEAAASLIAGAKKIAYHSWSGVAQHTNATQTERAIATLYALTGCFDQEGCNRIYASHPVNVVNSPTLMPKSQWDKALGLEERPIGPPSQGWVHSQDIWHSVLEGTPYKIRGLIGFGANILLSQSDTSLGQQALEALEFYAHVDLFETPTSKYADILLPVNTAWEREGLRTGFESSAAAQDHIQLRKKMVSPRGESRSDLEIVFDLACRLGMNEAFFDGNIEAAWNYQLEPLGLTVEMLRNKPEGYDIPLEHKVRKYAFRDPNSGYLAGFNTETKRAEFYSEILHRYGYNPLPEYVQPQEYQRNDPDYPLMLTSVKSGFFCHSQHRSLTSLRKKAPYPTVDISAALADEEGIKTGDWVEIETRAGLARFRAKVEAKLSHETVIAEFGWWQACPDFGKPSYPVKGEYSSNYNSLISGDSYDPVSGALPLRSFRCRIRRLNDFELIRRPWEGRKTFKVIELKKEADNVTTVTFQSNSEGYLPDYEPGQHITVSCCPMSDSEEIVTRAYSLTGPAFVHDRKTYSISVRHQKATDEKGEYVEGIMSSYINTHLQIGKDVELTPPGGNFIVPLNAVQPVVIFAGGIGITPFISYLESINPQAEGPEIWLFYANQNSRLHAFKKRIAELNASIDRLKVINIYNQPLDCDIPGLDYDRAGYVGAGDVEAYLIETTAR
ncbi:molybdopterin-dependent oxidoreductase [Citrobacter freundii]|uniref:molybdopterin-dependent oxidoreductase n=1 Tax=Citrobacter freundii TaxID=546 RepID=UPI0025A094EF|nr:molybdopterin-dependent oxidoreductase [Citrobacter freundii]MDM7202307.1 molybdopterin-dependent oxidoreductase [Citrobacter freundii]